MVSSIENILLHFQWSRTCHIPWIEGPGEETPDYILQDAQWLDTDNAE